MEVLYHYTSLKCYEGIRQSSLVKQSIIPGRKDGVYLTKLDPWTFNKQQLIKNNYRAFNDYKIERVECYVKIWLSKSQFYLLEKEDKGDGRDIWIYGGRDLELNSVPHEYGLVASETVSRIWQQLEQKNQRLDLENNKVTHKVQQLEQENKQMKHQIKQLEQKIIQTQELELKNKHLELENHQITHQKQQIEHENKQLTHKIKQFEHKTIQTQELEQKNKQQEHSNQQTSQEKPEFVKRNTLLKQRKTKLKIRQIFIRKLEVGNITYVIIPFQPSDTIQNIKLRIQEKENIPLDQQKLIFGGKQLEDRNSMADYNIQNLSTINLLNEIEKERYQEELSDDNYDYYDDFDDDYDYYEDFYEDDNITIEEE